MRITKPTFASRFPFFMTAQATRDLLALRRSRTRDPVIESLIEDSEPAPLFVCTTMDGDVETIEVASDFAAFADEPQAGPL